MHSLLKGWVPLLLALLLVSRCAQATRIKAAVVDTEASGAVQIGGNGPVQAKQIFADIVENLLTCLLPFKLEVVQWVKDGGYFLRSSMAPLTVVEPPLNRTYQMHVNPQLFNTSFGPSYEALFAIILHESNHIRDYTTMDVEQLAEFGLEYSANYSYLVDYEHVTDMKVMQMDYWKGLKEYRQWIYTVLTPSQVETKKIEYYTPDQIDDWRASQPATLPNFNPCFNASFTPPNIWRQSLPPVPADRP